VGGKRIGGKSITGDGVGGETFAPLDPKRRGEAVEGLSEDPPSRHWGTSRESPNASRPNNTRNVIAELDGGHKSIEEQP